jgi:hypothetical protein
MGRKKRRPAKCGRPLIIIIIMLGCCVCERERLREREVAVDSLELEE